MKVGFNYDKIKKNIGLKYAIPIVAAKRAEMIKNQEEEIDGKVHDESNYVTRAYKEIEENKVKIKDIDKLDVLKTDVKI